jgi:GNAT superfamily N-acetyltransferase
MERALVAAAAQRGGPELANTIAAGRAAPEVLADAVRAGALVVAFFADAPVGFALVGDGVVQMIFVEERYRRRGVARSLLAAVIASKGEALDAFALPGDRATKSLYESFGWKARLLTMRAE